MAKIEGDKFVKVTWSQERERMVLKLISGEDRGNNFKWHPVKIVEKICLTNYMAKIVGKICLK